MKQRQSGPPHVSLTFSILIAAAIDEFRRHTRSTRSRQALPTAGQTARTPFLGRRFGQDFASSARRFLTKDAMKRTVKIANIHTE